MKCMLFSVQDNLCSLFKNNLCAKSLSEQLSGFKQLYTLVQSLPQSRYRTFPSLQKSFCRCPLHCPPLLASGGCRSAFCLYVFVFSRVVYKQKQTFFFKWLPYFPLRFTQRFICVVFICPLALAPFPFSAEYFFLLYFSETKGTFLQN